MMKCDAVLADVKRNDASGQPATATTGSYKHVVSAPEPKRIASPAITNIQGVVAQELKADGDPESTNPTIAIVAIILILLELHLHYLLEVIAMGVALWLFFEIARFIFIYLYSNPKTRGRYNLLFGLNIPWLRSFDQRLRESIDYGYLLRIALIHGTTKLWIHGSFGARAVFKVRVTAATLLPNLSAPPELLEMTGCLSDSIGMSMSYQGKNMQIFGEDTSLAVNAPYIRSWLDLLSQTPRVAPFLSKNDPFVMALKKELEDHTHEVNVQHEAQKGGGGKMRKIGDGKLINLQGRSSQGAASKIWRSNTLLPINYSLSLGFLSHYVLGTHIVLAVMFKALLQKKVGSNLLWHLLHNIGCISNRGFPPPPLWLLYSHCCWLGLAPYLFLARISILKLFMNTIYKMHGLWYGTNENKIHEFRSLPTR
ncbi:hypothetical protein NC653_012026 [Populus alba x Populus x berolinensis]|uniref:Uncharacterized protein n=1 Tax=Populus alba x Populus x berolinensis TaxID=444605 RepID=A0AAD6W744_9ROSI|nr:hypothetical protein NC653_012026 [Populus alba x Populus x berolinensis]